MRDAHDVACLSSLALGERESNNLIAQFAPQPHITASRNDDELAP